MRDALDMFLKSNRKQIVTVGRQVGGTVRMAIGYKPVRTSPPQCRHLKGYWINYCRRQFRCIDCGFQYHLSDVPKAKGRKIEAWSK